MSIQLPSGCDDISRQLNSDKQTLEQLQQQLLVKSSENRTELQQQVAAAVAAVTKGTDDLATCVARNTQPVFNAAPVANIPPINSDASPTQVFKPISLGFLQTKFDEFFNKRTDIPLFKLRLDHFSETGQDSPNSSAELFFVNPAATNANPIYDSAIFANLGQQPHGYYFDNVDSQSWSLTVDATLKAPIQLQIIFDCNGDVGLKSSSTGTVFPDVAPDIQFSAFQIDVRFTITNDTQTDIDFLSWAKDYTEIDNNKIAVGTVGAIKAVGSFLGETVDETFVTHDDYEDFFATQVVDVYLSGDILHGTAQKSIRHSIFEKLVANRDSFNQRIRPWLLGGNGSGIVSLASITDNTLKLNYTVPANILNPFPAPSNWPASGASVAGSASFTGSQTIDFSQGNLANIDHIIVLTMENRSFDQILGYLKLPVAQGGQGRTEVDGLTPGMSNFYNGQTYPIFPFAPGATIFQPDPNHGTTAVSHQIQDSTSPPFGQGKMDGFVRSYAEEASPVLTGTGASIMGYHTGINLPAYDALARDFAISHRWFAAHPGPTFCNRFYEMTGYLNRGCGLPQQDPNVPNGVWEFNNSSPLTPVFTPTIFDHLQNAGVSWAYFEHGYCFLRFFSNFTFDDQNIASAEDPQNGFFARAGRGDLPSVTFIDPHFVELAPGGNCDGPPADVAAGQALVQRVVEAVITSPLWPKTLLLITYDEHGGFRDHVPPPLAPAPATGDDNYAIKTHGVRVPAFVVSPWVQPGTVFGHDDTGGGALIFDHTSILKTIARRFLSTNPPYMGQRYAAAQDLSAVVGSAARTSQFLPFIRYHLSNGPSQQRLAVQNGSSAPDTLLLLAEAEDTQAQNFSFEDAGDGLVYIRTHCSQLYVTVDVPAVTIIGGSAAASPPGPRGITQNLKYSGTAGLNPTADGPTGVAGLGGLAPAANLANPAYQRWKITPAGGGNLFTITNEFFANLLLAPLNPATPGSPVVLEAPSNATPSPSTWLIEQALFILAPTIPKVDPGLIDRR